MESRAKTAGIAFLIITVVWSLVIWSFSLKNAESSTVDSNAAKSAIESIIETVFGEDVDIDTNLIRKLAHFCEFAVLGFLAFMTFYFLNHRGYLHLIVYPALWGLVVAVTDEFIQLFFEGRSAELSDVFLDLSGAVAAATVLAVIVRITNKKSRR